MIGTFRRSYSRVSVPALGVIEIVAFGWLALGAVVHRLPSGVSGKAAESAPPTVTTNAGHDLTADDLGAFLDGRVPSIMQRDDIAGAVVVVVKDGKVLLARGYGYADIAAKKRVSPEETLFRPASISKLFTWTAVMQLVEQGRLDLDRDVNTYLDFEIPHRFGKAVTLRHLMTHRAGFEESLKDLFVADVKKLTPLGPLLAAHLPRQIFVPGTTTAYSNYGAGLAGYIVQRVSERPFEDYIDEFIFQPLRMTHSTFRQPVPEPLGSLLSRTYSATSQPALETEWMPMAPAGGLSTTGADMARFMLAHLGEGELDGVRILKPETARLMHAGQVDDDAAGNGFTLGFIEKLRNGHRMISHNGRISTFRSDLNLMPDAGLGFFISCNGPVNCGPVWQHVFDRYFPPPGPEPPMLASAEQDGNAVAGRYLTSRRIETNGMNSLFQEIEVTAGADHTITTDGGEAWKTWSGAPKRWREVAPFVFQEVNGPDRILFQRDLSGRLRLVGAGWFAAEHADSMWSYDTMFVIYLVPLGAFFLTLLAWPVGALVRRHYGRKLSLSRQQRWQRWIVRIVCACNLAGLFFPLFAEGWFRAAMIMVVGLLGTVFVGWAAVGAWRSREYGFLTKLWYVALVPTCLVQAWNVFHGHLY